MTFAELSILLPELVLLAGTMLVLILGLLAGRHQTRVSYWLSQCTLVITIFFILSQIEQPTIYALHNMFVLDQAATLSKLAILIFAIFALGYSEHFFKAHPQCAYDYSLLFLLSVLGMMTIVSSHHLIPLYLGLELMSLPLYALVAIKHHGTSAEAAMKYFVMGAFASALLLYGVSLIYGATAQLNLTAIAQSLHMLSTSHAHFAIAGIVFIAAALAFKFGAAPFHQWVPDVYQAAPTPVSAFIGSAPKVAVLLMGVRLFGHAFDELHVHWEQIWIFIAIISMAWGNLGAIAQNNIRRMLAYSAIAHMGYMILGFLTGTEDGYAASLFYVGSYALMTLAGFGALIVVSNQGFMVETIEDLRGLNWRNPWVAFMILIIMFSMAGIPPSVGFFAKMGVLEALIAHHQTWLAVVALVFAIIGSYYYLRVVKAMYFEPVQDSSPLYTGWHSKVILSLNSLLILALGIFPSFIINLCRAAYF